MPNSNEAIKQTIAGTPQINHAQEQPRTYNPVDQAQRATVSEKLNTDASKYKKGPNPQTF